MNPSDGDSVGLSPEEERAFAEIAYGWRRRSGGGIPWPVVVVSVAVVAVAALGGLLLGVPGAAVALFSVTFLVVLAAGLLVISRRSRR